MEEIKLKIGDKAPDFVAKNQNGEDFRLSDLLGKKNIVLYFYPKDFSAVCTAEACAFRDAYDVFVKSGAEIVGISSDSYEVHKKFIEKHNLPFVLLSDPNNKLRELFGVRNIMLFIPGRVTFIIDKEGIIRYIYSAILEDKKHMEEALKIVEDLQTGKKI